MRTVEAQKYLDSPEHRATIYSLHAVPEMRGWAKQDFLDWLERYVEERMS